MLQRFGVLSEIESEVLPSLTPIDSLLKYVTVAWTIPEIVNSGVHHPRHILLVVSHAASSHFTSVNF